MRNETDSISIWFFIGVLLAFYGALIFGYGVYAFNQPTDRVLARLHADVWWGAVLLLVGLAYSFKFFPRKSS